MCVCVCVCVCMCVLLTLDLVEGQKEHRDNTSVAEGLSLGSFDIICYRTQHY